MAAIRFSFKPPKPAKEIFVCGDFNGWGREAPMAQLGKDWVSEMEIAPGEYEYKFLVDGIWFNDPNAVKQVPNLWGSDNSLLVVKP